MNDELIAAQRRQLRKLAEAERTGDRVGGWKLGLTSGQSRDAFGPGIRPFGFILESRILHSGDTLDWKHVETGGIENELCFAIRRDVIDNVNPASVAAFVAGMAPAFEINQRRIDLDSPPPERVADGLANWGIVVGETIAIPDGWIEEKLEVTLSHAQQTVVSVAARGHIDSHFATLATLANHLLEFDRHLKAGDLVITGAFGRQTQPDEGIWTGDFGDEIGQVSVHIKH